MTETEEIIETVNKDVLKSFKTLQKNKNILYTSACNNYLISINDYLMIIYTNIKEIDFKGTFKLTRNKLIPVEHKLIADPSDLTDIKKFKKLKSFDKNMIIPFQKYCYENNLHVNIADIIETIKKLFIVYDSFTLFKNLKKNEIMLTFSNSRHKTYLISKLL